MLKARLDALEARVSESAVASGHQVGWAAGGLGARIDALEDRVERAAALAQPLVGDEPLRPGTRIVHRHARPQRARAICSLATGPYIELLDIAGRSFRDYARTWGWDLVVSTEDLSDGRPAPWAKIRLVSSLLEEYEWVLWIDADAAFVDLERHREGAGGRQGPLPRRASLGRAR